MHVVDEDLRERLLKMAAADLALRARLAADGSLFDDYHPEMRAVHEANADALADILVQGGWPTEQQVGADGAEAAWLVVQHAISRPALCRTALEHLQRLGEAGAVPRWQAAYLDDRIRVFEGRPQLYGTSFDWDEDGEMNPRPIDDPDGVDQRRAQVGIEPLDHARQRHRESDAAQHKPADSAERRRDMDGFARSVGWRSSS